MMTPNEEQIEFINSRNSNVLVSASAGSGKTFTMIQKLIHIITNEKVSINSLLVLTFTEAAASEIKQRLYNEITTLLNTSDKENRDFLQKQLDNINDAEIGTLHSVCKKLLIKYFYKLDISPDFQILSEKESKYLLDNAVNEVLERKILSEDEMFFDLYDCYNSKRNDSILKSIIFNLLNYLNNKYDYKAWIYDVINNSFDENLDNNSVCLYIFELSKKLLGKYIKNIETLLLESNNLSLERYSLYLYNRKQFIDEIINAKSFIQLLKILNNSTLVKKPIASKKASALEIAFDERVCEFHKSFADELKGIGKLIIFNTEEEINNNFAVAKKNIVKLLEVVEEIRELYNTYKRNKNNLDFNDLEDKMLDLLNIEDVKNVIKEQYKYVFFDEYQDINEKQEMILSKIVSQDNYYMIGDVKQSIYAFRQSSPKIFIDKFQSYQQDNEGNKVINFTKNYRSDRNILEVNNFIFDTLITKDTIGIDYKSTSRFDSINEFKSCNVDMKIINTNIDLEIDEDIDKDRKEAILIADTIASILTKTKSDGTRYTYKDIAIILRKRGEFLKTLCDVLVDMQIPISTTISNDFFNTFEIQLLLAILQVVSNYKNDIAISIVLKNLFGIEEDSLLKIKQSSDCKYFYECIENYSIEDNIKNSIGQFFDFLDDSRMLLSKFSLQEYIEIIIDKFNILQFVKSQQDGDKRETNVLEFISLLDSEHYKYNLDKFLEYVEYISKDTSLQKIGISGNSVQIITIHYSKGLEYPAVIFAGLGKKFSLNKDTNDIIINDNFGIGLKSIDSHNRILQETLIRNVCKLDNKQSEINEEIRLLYVAMTRPKEYLCLIGQYNLANLDAIKTKGVYDSKNYLDMIFHAVNKKDIGLFITESKFYLNEHTTQEINVEIYSCEQISDSEKIIDNYRTGEINTELLQTLKNCYDNAPNIQTYTIKNTVTNILTEQNDYENLNHAPKLLDIKDEIVSKDYLKIGTAYHSIMQRLDFTESKQDIEIIINNMILNRELSDDVAKDIKLSEIYNAKENLKNIILHADKIYREKQFVMQENYNKLVKNSDNNTKVIIQGIIDLVVIKDNKAILIDYKTNRTTNEFDLISKYSLQLALYKIAFEKATGITIDRSFLYSFHLNKLIEVK